MHPITKLAARLVKGHLAALYKHADLSLQLGPANSNLHHQFRIHNPHYLYPICMFLCAGLYGIFGLVLRAEPQAAESLADILHSKYLFTHVCFPREVWPQTDAIWTIGIVGSCSIYLALFFSSAPPSTDFDWLQLQSILLLILMLFHEYSTVISELIFFIEFPTQLVQEKRLSLSSCAPIYTKQCTLCHCPSLAVQLRPV